MAITIADAEEALARIACHAVLKGALDYDHTAIAGFDVRNNGKCTLR